MKLRYFAALPAALACLAPLEALARIKLITLPPRERVEIQLDHSNVTLVEEERIVPLVKGVNQVDFSWANTQIDGDSIVFRVLDNPNVKVLAVSYPPNENALVWSVSAKEAGTARARISYVLGNLNKSYSYRALTAQDEKTLSFSQYIHIENYANEEYSGSSLWPGFGEALNLPVGLDETRKVLTVKYSDVPVRKTYTCDPVEFGYLDRPKNKLKVPMRYVVKNSQDGKLGQAALPAGKARIFQDDGKGGSAFVGEDWGKFTPRDDELELYLGVAQDIVVTRTIEKNERQRVAGNLDNHRVVVKYEIENFKDQPVTLDVAENLLSLRNEVRANNGREVEWELGGETTFQGPPDPEKSAYDKVLYHAELPARDADGKAKKIVHKLEVLLKNEW
jgi:hypothetical protein